MFTYRRRASWDHSWCFSVPRNRTPWNAEWAQDRPFSCVKIRGFIYLFCVYLFSFQFFFSCFKFRLPAATVLVCPFCDGFWNNRVFSYAMMEDSWKSSLWQKWTANNKGKQIKIKIPGHSLHVKEETSKTGKITQEPGNEVKANTLLL